MVRFPVQKLTSVTNVWENNTNGHLFFVLCVPLFPLKLFHWLLVWRSEQLSFPSHIRVLSIVNVHCWNRKRLLGHLHVEIRSPSINSFQSFASSINLRRNRWFFLYIPFVKNAPSVFFLVFLNKMLTVGSDHSYWEKLASHNEKATFQNSSIGAKHIHLLGSKHGERISV
jgi:hypothetical protein